MGGTWGVHDGTAYIIKNIFNSLIYAKIGSDLSMFDYSIDDTLKQIYYSTSDTNSTPNYEYLKFDQYQIRAVYKQNIEKSGFYYSFISNWGGYSDSIRIEYNMTNPGNEHLSLDTIPNKLTWLIFFSFCGYWCSLLV